MRNRVLKLLILAPLLLVCVAASWQYAGMLDCPATSTPLLGAELAPDNCATSPRTELSGTTGWTNPVLKAMDTFESTTKGDEPIGSFSLHGVAGADDDRCYTTAATISGAISRADINYVVVNGDADTGIKVNIGISEGSGAALLGNGVASTNWATLTQHFIAPAVTTFFTLIESGAGNDANFYINSFSTKSYLLPSLLAPTRPFAGNGRFYVTTTTTNCGTGEWLGVASYLDSPTNPTKGLFAYLNRTTGNAELRVLTAANTWTSLINTAVTFSSGAQLVLVYDSDLQKAWLFYNNAIVGAAQDVSAYAWLRTNRRHAIFSTTAVTPGSVIYDFGPIQIQSTNLVPAGAIANWTSGYDTFSGATNNGFSGISDGVGDSIAVTPDQIPFTVGHLYVLDWTVSVNSGAGPRVSTREGVISGFIGYALQGSAGANRMYFVADSTDTGVIQMDNLNGTAGNFALSGLNLRRVQ